jgi:hypothetical protein
MTDLGAVLEQLKQERGRLDRAIAALSGVVKRKSGFSSGSDRSGKRFLSAAGRNRLQPRSGHGGRKFELKKRGRAARNTDNLRRADWLAFLVASARPTR